MRKLGALLDGLDDPGEIIGRLFNATKDPWFQQYAEATALKMVTHLFTDSGRTWRQAAKVNSQGAMLYKALMDEMNGPLGPAISALIQQNAQYIKSVPADVARQFTEHIMSKHLAGLRPSDIARELQAMYKDVSEVKANLIARTETAKTATALTQARSEMMGIEWYEWRTSEDQRVRSSHRHMDHVLIAWNDPPSPEELNGEDFVGYYHAGCIWNCRCYAQPFISLDEINWPHKVYRNGTITTMTRAQFERIWKPKVAV
ncbi:MAG: minor capsid protein [Alicyclobacillus sp.]|nr:minor capsid protein [Alicyclobacillus sp.]